MLDNPAGIDWGILRDEPGYFSLPPAANVADCGNTWKAKFYGHIWLPVDFDKSWTDNERLMASALFRILIRRAAKRKRDADWEELAVILHMSLCNAFDKEMPEAEQYLASCQYSEISLRYYLLRALMSLFCIAPGGDLDEERWSKWLHEEVEKAENAKKYLDLVMEGK